MTVFRYCGCTGNPGGELGLGGGERERGLVGGERGAVLGAGGLAAGAGGGDLGGLDAGLVEQELISSAPKQGALLDEVFNVSFLVSCLVIFTPATLSISRVL